MSGQDLLIELTRLMKRIDAAIDTLAQNGKRLAIAESNYRQELAKLILKMRDANMPVTIISDVCRGDSEIAMLKQERDIAQAVYDANGEAIQAWKLKARLWEAQISREWGRKE